MKQVNRVFSRVILAVALTSAAWPAFAQDKAIRYTGALAPSGACPLNNAQVQIDITGEELKGFFVSSKGGKARFEGKMNGEAFRVIYTAKAGDQYTIEGKRDGDKLNIQFGGMKCNHRGVLAKAA